MAGPNAMPIQKMMLPKRVSWGVCARERAVRVQPARVCAGAHLEDAHASQVDERDLEHLEEEEVGAEDVQRDDHNELMGAGVGGCGGGGGRAVACGRE